MTAKRVLGIAIVPVSAFLFLVGLGNQACSEGEDDASADGDSDNDTDSDTDTDADTDSDSDGDSDGDTGESLDTEPPEIRYAFSDDSMDGFLINEWSQPEELAAESSLAFNADDGNPSDPPGCAELTIPYSGPDQKVIFQLDLAEEPLDLTGKTLSAKINLVSGMTDDETVPGGAKVYIKTGDAYVYADGGWVNLTAGEGWITVDLEVNNPSFVDTANGDMDPTDVRSIGVEIDTNSTEAESYSAATVFVDSFAY